MTTRPDKIDTFGPLGDSRGRGGTGRYDALVADDQDRVGDWCRAVPSMSVIPVKALTRACGAAGDCHPPRARAQRITVVRISMVGPHPPAVGILLSSRAGSSLLRS